MPLPDLITIIPPSQPPVAEITVPGSKSITNRALILAALARGKTVLTGALWSEDTQVMVECLQRLGFDLEVALDPNEPSNRTITVVGQGGQVPTGGSDGRPLELFVGNAGTAARFLAAFVCLGQGLYRLSGVTRMHDRPQAALFQSLRQLGYRIETPNDRLPAIIHGQRSKAGKCQVSIQESSQFASALLLCAGVAGWNVEVLGVNPDESPYVEMTRQMVRGFPQQGGQFAIEPDASSGSYFVAADWLLASGHSRSAPSPAVRPLQREFAPGSLVALRGWPRSGWQIDAAFPKYLPLPQEISRERDLGDSIMTAIVLAPLAEHLVRFTDLGRLRVQECERVGALRSELTKLGAKATEQGDTLTVLPSQLHGATIETYNDHRIAMCFAILGLKVPEIKIEHPRCVKKTFPNFFQKLSAPVPGGLGAVILDAQTGRALPWAELFAD
jgi:3-phosphoshikimate 1-carboxyvinyltransferase